MREYLDQICCDWLAAGHLISGCVLENGEKIEGITPEFIKSKKIGWLNQLHGWILNTQENIKQARYKAIFLDNKGNAVSALNADNEVQLFITDGSNEDYISVHPELLKQKKTCELLEKYGVKRPDEKDEVFGKILRRYRNNDRIDPKTDFLKIFSFYRTSSIQNRDELLKKIGDTGFIWYVFEQKNYSDVIPLTTERCLLANLFYPEEYLLTYYAVRPNTKFLNIKYYRSLIPENQKKNLEDFFSNLGLKKEVPILRYYPKTEGYFNFSLPDKYLDEGESILNYIVNNQSTTYSLLLWNILVQKAKFAENNNLALLFGEGERYYQEKGHWGRNGHYYKDTPESIKRENTKFVASLREKPWIIDTYGKFVSPNTVRVEQLSEQYNKSSDGIVGVFRCLAIDERTQKDLDEEERLRKEAAEREARDRDEAAQADLSDTNKHALNLGRSLLEKYNDEQLHEMQLLYEEKLAQERLHSESPLTNQPSQSFRPNSDICSNSRMLETDKKATSRNNSNKSGNEVFIEPETVSEDTYSRSDSDHAYRHNTYTNDKSSEDLFESNINPHSNEYPPNSFEDDGLKTQPEQLRHKRSDNPTKYPPRKDYDLDEEEENIAVYLTHRSRDINKSPSPPKLKVKDYSEMDEDYYSPRSQDFESQIYQARENGAKEIAKIKSLENLNDKLRNTSVYSFEWFKTLLKMELLNNEKESYSSREISIKFSKIYPEPNTNRTLILERPNGSIPQSIEDLSDYPLYLFTYDGHIITLEIEASSVRSFSLYVLVKNPLKLKDINYDTIAEAEIKVQNPGFLLESLSREFSLLGLSDEDNLQQLLPSNIDFIFGPPGTGKTTYLAEKELIPRMESGAARILVLTPTNKAADVLTNKIIEKCDKKIYQNWLIRFGTTCDERLEKTGIYKDRHSVSDEGRCVLVTTIARYPYDGYTGSGNLVKLMDSEWDYIIIDEASMISLAALMFVIYKSSPKHFIIAGDPFQIEPIVSSKEWKGMNIYTMVNLNSFTKPRTIPHDYKVVNLTTQYRSVPSIGEIYSNLAYGGALKHYRSEKDRLDLGLDAEFSSLTLIRFPVEPYEGIYKPKRLNNTPYHIYSAIFTYEYVSKLASKISKQNINKHVTIGVISPYRAQADMIDRLLSTSPDYNNISIRAGTIHGFQGDECDIVFVVLNTPPTISNHPDMFLNKLNIINVAISRARDYLFVILPDENTPGLSIMNKITNLTTLIRQDIGHKEYNSHQLETDLFGSATYIEDNVFSSTHQMVNVYSKPEKKYEIRSDDNAIDIQIINNSTSTENISKSKFSHDELKKMIDGTFTQCHLLNGMVNIAEVGDILRHNYPDFDIKKYGYQKLRQYFVESGYETREWPMGKVKVVFVKPPKI